MLNHVGLLVVGLKKRRRRVSDVLIFITSR